MSNLFMVMLGGRHARANTEVHDVVFVIGNTLQETYPQLKNVWFGEKKGLHIDAWMQINAVQGEGRHYQIQFADTQPNLHDEKLWLINLGGYDAREFGELHRYILVVAQSSDLAKQRGKAYFAMHWQKQHTDRVLEVDDCLPIDCIGGRYIRLLEGQFFPNQWENTYLCVD